LSSRKVLSMLHLKSKCSIQFHGRRQQLKPSQPASCSISRSACTVYLCATYNSYNKQLLFPRTALTKRLSTGSTIFHIRQKCKFYIQCKFNFPFKELSEGFDVSYPARRFVKTESTVLLFSTSL